MFFLKCNTRACYFYLVFLLQVILLFQTSKSYSQHKPVNFGRVIVDDFTLNNSSGEPNSNAVILADVGSVKFEGNSKGWFTYVYKRQKRIKILDKKAFGLATVQILLYQNKEAEEKVEKLSAVTYNLENGRVTETKLDLKDTYKEKVDKNYSYKKFLLPGVKEGSIIEYSYTIKSDFEFNLPSWEFQSEAYPTLWSEYNVTIPGLLSYISFLQGYNKFYIANSSDGFQNYTIIRSRSIGGYSTNTKEESISVSSPITTHRWVMKDVPAFNVENYISSPQNLIDKISFQLYKTYDGESFHDVANSWGKVAEELMQRDDFGAPLTENNKWLDKILESLIAADDNELQSAKKIYYYILKNYTCTNHYNKYIKTSLQDVVKKKSGTVGDINLLLTALLNRNKTDALPVLLSTRDFGRNNPSYPLMERLNYIICKAKINSVDYYLDATKPFLSFGKLPLECYNGHARVISKDTTAVYFLTDSLKETNSVSVVIVNKYKNEIEGNYNHTMGFFESLDTKNKIAASTLSDYKSAIIKSYPEDVLIKNIQIDSLQLPEEPLSVKYELKLKAFEQADIIYFNPMLGEAIKSNPFIAAERFYPVEMPYTIDYIYTLNMETPNGYKVDEVPKSVRLNLNEDEGMFEYLISYNGKNIQLRCRMVLRKANFLKEDYNTLRDFYSFIVKKEAEQIVFKKIKL